MRRYLQGTLDFACGIYAVINALSWLRSIDLAEGRRLFQKAHLDLLEHPKLFAAYLRNETDHYWLVRHMLSTFCMDGPHKLDMIQPFSRCLLPDGADEPLSSSATTVYLPEKEPPFGPVSPKAARREAEKTWKEFAGWFAPDDGSTERRAAVMRFHRFLPGFSQPLVSHWTTAAGMDGDRLALFDASSETGAIMEIALRSLLPQDGCRALLRIVPESLLLLRRAR